LPQPFAMCHPPRQTQHITHTTPRPLSSALFRLCRSDGAREEISSW
jgi:hypothetical protein